MQCVTTVQDRLWQQALRKKPSNDVIWFQQLLGQVFSQKLVPLKDQSKTAEGSPSDDDSYLGYSVATGDFNGDGDSTDVAVGMPRGANLTGKVRTKTFLVTTTRVF